MDLFEKQQRVDALRGIVKARWFYIAILGLWGFVEKLEYFSWGGGFSSLLVVSFITTFFGFNFAYWLFARRPLEKIGDLRLKIVSIMLVVVDQICYTLIFYFAGTVESAVFVLYFVTILVASSLFKTRGIVLSGLLGVFLCSGLITVDAMGLVKHMRSFDGTIWFSNIYVTHTFAFGIAFYMIAVIFFAVFLSNFIRQRETNLRHQRDQLVEQAQILTRKTEELTEAKDWLNGALIKSDKVRINLSRAEEDLVRVNIELKEKIREFEAFNEITVGREIRMKELKEKIKILEEKLKNPEG